MKRLIALLCIVFLLGGCTKMNFKDVTPSLDAIDSIFFQRTNIDENQQYTYYEIQLTDSKEIASFCAKLDEVEFVEIEPVEFTSVDYLIVFEGKKKHKLMMSGDEIIYDGRAYKIYGSTLKNEMDALYGDLPQEESLTDSKLFK